MTDVGNVRAGTVEGTPGPRRSQVQVVPLRGLPVVAAVVVFVIASIAGNWLWALTFCHVVGGALWTAIDLFVGLIVGPILGLLLRVSHHPRVLVRCGPVPVGGSAGWRGARRRSG
jgi:hypothetical protein